MHRSAEILGAAAESLRRYQDTLVITKIADLERMKSPNLDSYMFVGRSAIQCIYACQTIADFSPAKTILDFGCGHGRVSRHLSAYAPNARIVAADIRLDAVEFCAKELRCEPLLLQPTFGETPLPKGMDLIWVGSVFTHIDYLRQRQLWELLFDALAPKGLLIGTFHGRRAIDLCDLGQVHFIAKEKWGNILSEYERTGTGYSSYGIEELGNWGVSLNTLVTLHALPDQSRKHRIVSFAEGAWAGIQDIVCWQKL